MIQKNLVNRLNADPLGLSIKRAILFLLLAPLTLSACRSTISVVDYNLVSSDASSNISPLSHYIGMSAWQDADHALQLHADMTMRREELIAQCMLDAGFQYIPDIGSNRFSISGSIFDETKPNDLEWVSLYGFGIASGHIETAFSRSDRQGADPNQDYRDSLTKAELDAFFLALYGPDDLHPSPGMTE
ncbi:MAG: hypothetical protein FWG25_06595, partial [Promicromonosporaceae bacterium]|nr:hypothetical protein [Promicromonosporaceae bacterium]